MARHSEKLSVFAQLLAVGVIAMSFATKVFAEEDEPIIGNVYNLPAEHGECPEFYLPADGRGVTVMRYMQLYALYGNKYCGGPGENYFCLPKAEAPPPKNGVPMVACVALYGKFRYSRE